MKVSQRGAPRGQAYPLRDQGGSCPLVTWPEGATRGASISPIKSSSFDNPQSGVLFPIFVSVPPLSRSLDRDQHKYYPDTLSEGGFIFGGHFIIMPASVIRRE